jgi:hypothetical protein
MRLERVLLHLQYKGGAKPEQVKSLARWRAMLRFIERHFMTIPFEDQYR